MDSGLLGSCQTELALLMPVFPLWGGFSITKCLWSFVSGPETQSIRLPFSFTIIFLETRPSQETPWALCQWPLG